MDRIKPKRKYEKIVLKALCFFFGSILLARLWLNAPALWPPIPKSAWLALDWVIGPIRALDVHDQEEQDEFFMFWILSAAVILVLSSIGWGVRRYLRGRSKTD
jgi:hypothetical protein